MLNLYTATCSLGMSCKDPACNHTACICMTKPIAVMQCKQLVNSIKVCLGSGSKKNEVDANGK